MEKLLKQVLLSEGLNSQLWVLAEEMSELIKVISKINRYEDFDKAKEELWMDITDEMADVYICLQYLHISFDITPQDINKVQNRKLKRLERWLKSGKGIGSASLVIR